MVFVSFVFANNVTNQDSFWMEAAQDGRAEVIFSELALERSQNNEIKRLAQIIIDDYTQINEDYVKRKYLFHRASPLPVNLVNC